MQSAPAIMPATSAVTFAPACEPLSVGTLRCRSAIGQAHIVREPHDRDQLGWRHEIRFVEGGRRHWESVRWLHLRDVLGCGPDCSVR